MLRHMLLICGILIAIAAVPWARAAPSLAQIERQAFVLAGGALDDICGDDQGARDHHGNCLWCAAANGAVSPRQAGAIKPPQGVDLQRAAVLRSGGAFVERRDHSRSPQGPPTVSMDRVSLLRNPR